MGDRKTTTKYKSRTDPAAWLMPHIQSVLGSAANLYGGGAPAQSSPFPFSSSFMGGGSGGIFGSAFGSRFGGNEPAQPRAPQSTVAPFSQTTERALAGIENRAAQGSPVFAAGQQQLMDTIGGKYLTPESNPYLRQYGDYLSGHVQDRVNAEFSKAGRYGSGAHAGTTAREVGGLLSGFYSDAYGRERGLQHDATQQAPGYAGQEYTDLQNMLTAGIQRDVKAQQNVDDPYNQILRYLSIISGVPQGTQSQGTQTTTQHANAMDYINAIGGGLQGGSSSGLFSQIGSMFGGGAGASAAAPMLAGTAGASATGASAAALAAMLSDPAAKENIRPADDEAILQKFRSLPVSNYRYKEDAQRAFGVPEARTGPMADDYQRTFGGDGRTIDMGDALGNVMAAIRALEERTRKRGALDFGFGRAA